MPIHGCAVFGTHDDRHYRADFAEIAAAGFTWVNLPVTEQDATFDAAGCAAQVRAARAAGLEVWVSPWGVARRFGGEGISSVRPGDDLGSERAVARWLGVALAAHPDAVMWDEPRNLDSALFASLRRTVAAADAKNALVLEPETAWPDAATLTDVDHLGTDPYDWHRPDWEQWATHWATRAQTLAAQIGAEPHVWVRAFRIAAGQEGRIVEAARLYAGLDMPRMGYWGAFGSRSVGCLACARPDEAWEATKAAVGDLPKREEGGHDAKI